MGRGAWVEGRGTGDGRGQGAAHPPALGAGRGGGELLAGLAPAQTGAPHSPCSGVSGGSQLQYCAGVPSASASASARGPRSAGHAAAGLGPAPLVRPFHHRAEHGDSRRTAPSGSRAGSAPSGATATLRRPFCSVRDGYDGATGVVWAKPEQSIDFDLPPSRGGCAVGRAFASCSPLRYVRETSTGRGGAQSY